MASLPEDRFEVAWPTLWVASDWIQAHCVIPDGDRIGEPYELADWQLWCHVNHNRVRPGAQVGQRAPAFHYRRSLIVSPQKAGKSPFEAAHTLQEAVGPALFAGWAGRDDGYACADHGCRCGWEYRYERGEAMGRPWPTPLIQVTAFSDDQADNIFDAIRGMITGGPLGDLIPKVGAEFIRTPGGGRIDRVTSSARSRLGQRVTFVPQDETGLWTPTSGMTILATTQRRGLAGMGGRSVELTNPWDPSERSVAQRTWESKRPDIFKFWRRPPDGLSYRDKRDRRRIHTYVYRGSPWVDLDGIEAEAAELLETDPAQAERFFGNRVVATSDSYFDAAAWVAAASPAEVPEGATVCLGFDGSQFDDWTAIRARWVRPDDEPVYAFTPAYGDGAATIWRPEDFDGEIPRGEVHAAVEALFARYRVVRMYADPPLWMTELDEWAAKFGEKRVVSWPTYRPRPMGQALERLRTDIATGAVTHDGDDIAEMCLRNARTVRRPGGVLIGKPNGHQKIDVIMADALAHEAAADAKAAGETTPRPRGMVIFS